MDQANRLRNLLDHKIANYGKLGLDAMLQGIDSDSDSDFSGSSNGSHLADIIEADEAIPFSSDIITDKHAEDAKNELYNRIIGDQSLAKKDKEDLINEFNANV